jgi:hypothetical protein
MKGGAPGGMLTGKEALRGQGGPHEAEGPLYFRTSGRTPRYSK